MKHNELAFRKYILSIDKMQSEDLIRTDCSHSTSYTQAYSVASAVRFLS